MPLSEAEAPFPVDLDWGLNELRHSVGVIIESVCGNDCRPKDVADKLGIHAKLGWQFWNVAYGSVPEALRCLPNNPGFELLRSAARSHDVPSEVIDDLDAARDQLQGVFAVHAEDREMLQLMLEARSDNPDPESVLRWRKSAFLGNAFTFGVRAKCIVATAVLFPDGLDRFSLARIHGLVGLVRTRAEVRWPISTLVVDKESEGSTYRRESLSGSEGTSTSLLEEFCSQPLPKVERRKERDTITEELAPGIVGLTGRSTIFTGDIIRNVGPTWGTRHDEIAHFGSGVRTPSEFLISDHIVHKDLFPQVRRELRVYSELATPQARDDADRLSVPEKLETLGSGLSRTRTADVPRYTDLLNHVFERIGHDPSHFDVYRVRMPYPPLPISVMVRHLLPEKP